MRKFLQMQIIKFENPPPKLYLLTILGRAPFTHRRRSRQRIRIQSRKFPRATTSYIYMYIAYPKEEKGERKSSRAREHSWSS